MPIHQATIGELECSDFRCFTLELPWLHNEQNKSCIPAGEYQWEKHQSPSKGECLLISGVPGRTWILLHLGNFTRDTQGCILVGDGIVHIDGDNVADVRNSKATMYKLLAALPDRGFIRIAR